MERGRSTRDPAVLVSPCDAIVGASGTVDDGQVLQIKGFPYALADLLCDADAGGTFRDGCYVTLRLTSSMYHRFHAPYDCRVESVTHISGDTWNVNPIALRRVERLFCKNERAVIRTTLSAAVPGDAGRRSRRSWWPASGCGFWTRSLRDHERSAADISLRRIAQQGRGDGMVRAWLDHHRVRAGRVPALRHGAGGRDDPRGRAR